MTTIYDLDIVILPASITEDSLVEYRVTDAEFPNTLGDGDRVSFGMLHDRRHVFGCVLSQPEHYLDGEEEHNDRRPFSLLGIEVKLENSEDLEGVRYVLENTFAGKIEDVSEQN